MLQRGIRSIHRAQQVGFDHLLVFLHRDSVEFAVSGHAGIVHPDVEAAEFVERSFRQRIHVILVAHVALHRERANAVLLALGGNLLQQLVASRSQHQVGAFGGKLQLLRRGQTRSRRP